MWKITIEGRQILRKEADEAGGRNAFALRAGIGKNQVKPILDDPDHAINARTRDRLRSFYPAWTEGIHFVSANGLHDCDVRLARDRSPVKVLSPYDQRGIERLYDALHCNPAFERMRPVLISLNEAKRWFQQFGNASEDMISERFFVFRVFREKVIAFLYGEKLLRVGRDPGVFAIWYLVGTTNAFYDGSPVGLGDEASKCLPLGERESAVRLGVRLLEEIRHEPEIHYLVFEVEADDLAQPDSMGRLLFRVYSHAEDEVRDLFRYDRRLEQSRFFVLDFPYMAPMMRTASPPLIDLVEHRLVCCPLTPELARPFHSGSVPGATVERILASVYRMYGSYYDLDSPAKAAVESVSSQAINDFRSAYVEQGTGVPCFNLRAYVKEKFGAARRV